MSYPLAIVTPLLGVCSETFIQRHIQDLLPGQIVVIAAETQTPEINSYSPNCPTLWMNWLAQAGFKGRKVQIQAHIVQALTKHIGWHSSERSWTDVKQFLRDHQVQVIMGEYLDQSLPWLDVSEELGIRFFGHAHGYDISSTLRHSKWRKKYLRYNQASGIITMSQVSKKKLLELGLHPNKVHVIPYGVQIPTLPLQRSEHKVVRCLAVGRMVAKKAPLKTLEAFRQALTIYPELHLDYIGTGELLSAAQVFIHSFSLEHKVKLHGAQSHETVKQFMSRADIFLQHSMTDPRDGNEEGLPVAILEAMAHSLPVIATRHAGIPEAVSHGLTGYLVEEGDSTQMADFLVNLAGNSALRQQMGYAGWSRARDNFSWEQEQKKLLNTLGLRQVMPVTSEQALHTKPENFYISEEQEANI